VLSWGHEAGKLVVVGGYGDSGKVLRTRADDWLLTLGYPNRPKDPLRVLGEFLLQRSKELEGKET
jgi:hypothetical protein